MALPNFQDLMLPLLKQCSDDKLHDGKELTNILADHFNLTEKEKNERLGMRRQTKFANLVSWSQSHLKAAKLLEKAEGRSFKITSYGHSILSKGIDRIDCLYLRTLPEYQEAIKGTGNKKSILTKADLDLTPQEMIESAYEQMREGILVDLIDQIKKCPPSFFESLVVELLLKMGYGGALEDVGEAIGSSGDEGIDGIVKEDRLGFEIIYIQAKRWEKPVGRPEIQKFVGAIHGKHAKKGLFITTSKFTAGALNYVCNLDVKIILIDGIQLVELMVDYGLGVNVEKSYNIYRIDTDYFIE